MIARPTLLIVLLVLPPAAPAADVPEVPRTVANPVRLGFAAMRTAGPAPALGAQSHDILREAGFDDAGIEALRRSGALG